MLQQLCTKYFFEHCCKTENLYTAAGNIKLNVLRIFDLNSHAILLQYEVCHLGADPVDTPLSPILNFETYVSIIIKSFQIYWRFLSQKNYIDITNTVTSHYVKTS